jgi:PEP-CTERM motif
MFKSLVTCGFTLVLVAGMSATSTLYVGNDTNTPVAVYMSDGTFVQNFGQNFATGSAINGAGHVWTVAPSFGNNNIVEYDPAQNVLNSFIATINGQWVEDMSHGVGSTLWLGTFEGNVFAVNDQTGAILSSFSVANSSFSGVAFDGTNLWVSGGLTSNALYYYTTSGALLNTVPLGAFCMGVGYDASDGTLWCGNNPDVNHYDTSGNLLGSFNAQGYYHDGLEVANLTSSVPEPSSLLLAGTGLAALLRRLRKHS